MAAPHELFDHAGYHCPESPARESIAVYRKALAEPTENLSFSTPLTRLGLILNKTGRSRQGESYIRQSLAIRTHFGLACQLRFGAPGSSGHDLRGAAGILVMGRTPDRPVRRAISGRSEVGVGAIVSGGRLLGSYFLRPISYLAM